MFSSPGKTHRTPARRPGGPSIQSEENDMTTKTMIGASAVASALMMAVSAATLLSNVSAASAADAKEKCFGVAMAGKNDCAAGPGTTCAGTSKVDYQGNSWKYVAKGTCMTMKLPGDRHGAMSALKRDIPA
jgi:uncharacterized membrane protein